MRNRRNYYRILHCQPDAPLEIIRASYRTLMLRLRMHPDLGGDHWNAALINEAFATLGDPARRAAYDETLSYPFERMRHGGWPVSSQPGADPPVVDVPPPTCALCGAPHSIQDANRDTAMCAVCGSPVCAVVKQQRDATSRRALARMPRQVPIVFCLTWPHRKLFAGMSEDVSIYGLQFTSELELFKGERLRIDSAFCSAVSVVRHCRRDAQVEPAQWHTGVEFITLRIRRTRGLFVSADA